MRKDDIFKYRFISVVLILLEVSFFLFIFFFIGNQVSAGIGTNQTVISLLTVGESPPEIINISILNSSGSAPLIGGINLVANQTKKVEVLVIARDWNGDTQIKNVSAWFFDNAVSTISSSNDNNNHYYNETCYIDYNYGDSYEVNATCTFFLWYYANNATWNYSVMVNDTYQYNAFASNITTVNALLSLGVPENIYFGRVNATNVSEENVTNVTNFGNIPFNISLRGYAVEEGDNLSMNCTLGSIKNISILYERYNFTASNLNPVIMNYSEFILNYTNLTSSYGVVRNFNLNYRQEDGYNEATNTTYWRIYVPLGVAGECQGNIVYGAIQSPGY